MTEHSKLFSPSAAKRRFNCPGSARMEADLPNTTSVYAEEGSAAHHLAEICLLNGHEAPTYSGRYILRTEDGGHSILPCGQKNDNAFYIDQEMAEAVQEYVEICRSHQPGAEVMIEKQIHIVEGVFGTADHIAAVPFGPIYVDDYKHGIGVFVPAENNPQAMIYAIGALQASPYDHDVVHISIIQPRSRSGYSKEPWTISVPDLYKWRDEVLIPGIEACQKPDAPLAAGDHCKFCKAAGGCPELTGQVVTNTGIQTTNTGGVTLPAAAMLSPEEMARVLAFTDPLETWIKEVRDRALRLVEDGVMVPGFKAVAGRSVRKFTADAESVLVRSLGENAYNKKLIGIGDAEKALKEIDGVDVKATMASITVKPEGKPTLVPESDRRRALPPSAQRMFNAIG